MSEPHELEEYGQGITSADAKVPKWLKWCYILIPLWGILWMFWFWNGSDGKLDRGHWQQLERAANTTFPTQNVNEPSD